MKRDEKPIIVEEKFENNLESVWNAITEIEQMREWFFENIPYFKPKVGFEVDFYVDTGERSFLHQWKVTRMIPQKVIEYNWKYGGYPGDSFVTFKVDREKYLTKLRLTHTVTKDFPVDVPEFERESCYSGWRYFIKHRLKEYLRARHVATTHSARNGTNARTKG
jgi:uncharacterized protein YndB with AHSA1/START domain